MSDDVRKAAERLVNEATISGDYGGNLPLIADIMLVARFALRAAQPDAGQGAGAEGEVQRLRAALGEVRKCLDHLYSDLTYPIPKLPSVLYPFAGPISIMDRVVDAALASPSAPTAEQPAGGEES